MKQWDKMYEEPQDLLELTPKNMSFSLYKTEMQK